MAVVDEEKVEKAERSARAEKAARTDEGKTTPGGVGGALGWPGRKIAEGRAFLQDVRGELKKVTWPSGAETRYLATVVIIYATSLMYTFSGVSIVLAMLLPP